MTRSQKTIAIFSGENIVALQLLSEIVPEAVRQNLKPVVFIVPRKMTPKIAIPALQDYAFYDYGIVKNVIFPHLDSGHGSAPSLTYQRMQNQFGCEIHQVQNVDDPIVHDVIARQDFVGAISANNPGIFKKHLIETIRQKGFLWNLHHGVLPEARGLFIAFWSMLNGINHHGCTLHEIDEGIDTGRVISSCTFPLNKNKTMMHSYLDLVSGGAGLIKTALKAYMRDGSVSSWPQNESNASYYTFPSQEQIEDARQSGIKLTGSPMEMLHLYTALYGADPVLAEKIAMAIMAHEGGAAAETQRDVVKAA